MHNYRLTLGLSVEVKWVSSASFPASKFFRCQHTLVAFTTRRKFPLKDSLLYGPGKKQRGQCASPTRERRVLTKKVSTRRRALDKDETSSPEGEGNGGHFESQMQEDGGSTSSCLYVKKTVGDGEVIEHFGSIVILGDVLAGGHVLADGDVIVLGRLQGHVHAGRTGVLNSRVFATAMELGEIRICDSAPIFPRGDGIHSPKMACLAPDGSISMYPAVKDFVDTKQIASRDSSGHKRVGSAGQGPAGASRKVELHQIEGLQNQRPAQVALVTGVYIAIAGIAVLGFPKVLFGILFDLQGVKLGWVRVGAILAVVFGIYYIGTAVGDMTGMDGAQAFYLSTVVGRTFLFVSFFGLVVAGAVPSPLFLVGAVNLAGAMVMLKALLKAPVRSLFRLKVHSFHSDPP